MLRSQALAKMKPLEVGGAQLEAEQGMVASAVSCAAIRAFPAASSRRRMLAELTTNEDWLRPSSSPKSPRSCSIVALDPAPRQLPKIRERCTPPFRHYTLLD
eukprot:gnl/TRDRNA2_/TRDRNA2_168578_c0_seq1.p1 gnl/TRDRNA2_/TRDRNA2_168578_c0~~gnl/TRDRNA2_/TRDRNA2_168578_c0_seq1.p1  ORF type:complete len:102 (+),score=6.46 gnl/TRDRNA2_/TRDRNA2_168578_c0_seq1:151-456(+)